MLKISLSSLQTFVYLNMSYTLKWVKKYRFLHEQMYNERRSKVRIFEERVQENYSPGFSLRLGGCLVGCFD